VAPASGNVTRPGRALAVLVALIVVLFLLIIGSNAFQPTSWVHKDFRVSLGLDLTSGTTVSLKAQTPKHTIPKASEMQQALAIMQSRVFGGGYTNAQVVQQGNDVITVSVPGQGSQQVVNLVGQTAELRFRQVLLEAPNTGAVTATPTPSASASASATPSASASKSSASPSATAKASASSSAHAAGAPGTAAGTAGTQEMASRARALPAASASASPSASATASATPSASASPSPSATSGLSTVAGASGNPSLVSAPVQKLFNKLNCADKNWKQQVGYGNEQFDDPNRQIVACGSGDVKYALDKAKVLGTMVTAASATLSTSSVYWQTNLTFNSKGTAAFGALTTQMYDQYGKSSSPLDLLAVVLDGEVISPSSISQGPITGGSAMITGDFTQTEATSLANVLSYGALPLTFQKQSIQSVSPTLGTDQLDAGLLAGAIGLILVVVYCLLYYRGLAVVAVSSLVIAATLVTESVIVLSKYYKGFSLDLAGIAGLIVAIGITADSFVVFFERLRDEVREGRTLRTAVERGWKRARRTVLVSDTVSFLASALLWIFSIGDVKGFAFTLGLTTIIDVIVVFLFTKPMVTLLARTKFYGQGHPLSGLDPARLGARAPWRGSSPRPAASPARTSAKEA
jgi:preprotein translocase subunit SecD